MVIFPIINAFVRQEKIGAIQSLIDAANKRNVKIRILMPSIDNLALQFNKQIRQAIHKPSRVRYLSNTVRLSVYKPINVFYLRSSLFEYLFLFHVSVLATIFPFSFLNVHTLLYQIQKSLELFQLHQVLFPYIFPCRSSEFYSYCYHRLGV
jgi:hypothetical protein